jgi:Flp pilus assembly protein TadD
MLGFLVMIRLITVNWPLLSQRSIFGPPRALLLVACLFVGLCACSTAPEDAIVAPPPPQTATIEDPADVKYYPSDEPLRLAMEYFTRGQYGIAQRYYRDAVEKAPKDATAWIGLAASYDRLRRFDLADQAYVQAIKLSGETVQILNNQGYSYMLRGDLQKARLKFQKAYALDPTNPTIINNLELLNSSRRFIQRAPE